MIDKLNTCLLNDSFPPLIDGVANTIQNYAKVLTDNDDNATVVVPDHPDAKDEYNYDVVRYKSFPTTKLVGYRAGYPFSASVLEELEHKNFDIIHTHCPFMSTVIARMLRERVNIPVVFTYHTKFDIEIKRIIKGKKLQEKVISTVVKNIASCDEVWAVSNGAADNLRELGYTGDIVIMPNGIDFPKGEAAKETVDNIINLHSIDESKPIYLFVGRLRWYKGIKEIIDGLKILNDNNRDFTMIFIGKGEDQEEMQEYTKKLGLDKKCKFIGSVNDREILRGYYTLADLFIFPSSYDTFGLVVREAAACGTASMLVKNSCAAEGVSDNINSFLVDETGESVGQKLLEIGDNKELLSEVGKNAQETLYVSWEDSVKWARSRYNEIIQKYESGDTNRRKSRSDEFIDAIDEICDNISSFRDYREKVINFIIGGIQK